MDDSSTSIGTALAALLEKLLGYLPNLLGAIVLLIAGWWLARMTRSLSVRGVRMADTLLERFTGRSAKSIERSSALLGTILFWAVLLFFVTAATQLIGLQTFTDWLARLLDYLPTLAAGVLIIVAGYALASFVADLIHAAAAGLASAQRRALARFAQGTTLVAAILAVVVLAVLLAGVALAVSLGARGYVANLIGAHYLGQAFEIGQRVRVAGFEGRIVDLTATSLVLETEDGRVALPGRVFHEDAIVLLLKGEER